VVNGEFAANSLTVSACRCVVNVSLSVVLYACRDPLPLNVIHIPLCVTFAFFDNSKFMLVDPTQREQLVADGSIIVAMNKHREICMIETLGSVQLVLEQVGLVSRSFPVIALCCMSGPVQDLRLKYLQLVSFLGVVKGN